MDKKDENKLLDLQNQLKSLEREYKKLSKEVKPKLKRPLINRLLNRPVRAIPAPRQKVDKLNRTVIMISKLETEIALLKSSSSQIVDSMGFCKENLEKRGYVVKKLDLTSKGQTSTWNPYKELEQLEKEDPIKYKVVIEELEKNLKKDSSDIE